MAASKSEVVLTETLVEISTPFQMRNYVVEVGRHNGSPSGRITWQPTPDFEMAAFKPEVVLIQASVDIATPFQMLNWFWISAESNFRWQRRLTLETHKLTFGIAPISQLGYELIFLPVWWPSSWNQGSGVTGCFRRNIHFVWQPRKHQFSIRNGVDVSTGNWVQTTSGLSAAILKFSISNTCIKWPPRCAENRPKTRREGIFCRRPSNMELAAD